MFYRHPRFQFVYKRPWPIRKDWLIRHGWLKKLAYNCASVLLVAVVVVLNVLLYPRASATYTYNASNNIGQDHGTFTTPNYSEVSKNDAPPGNQTGYNNPTAVALDSVRHRFFVADETNMRIMVYNLDASNHFTNTKADYAIGQPDFANSNLPYAQSSCISSAAGASPAQNNLCMPESLAYDSVNNRLFVSDTGWARIMVYNLSGGISNTMNASYVLGQPNFTTVNTGASHGCYTTPARNNFCFSTSGSGSSAIAYDSAGKRLFVSDSSNNRVLVFNVDPATIANGENASNVLGQTDFISNAAGSGQNGFSGTGPLAYDPTGSRLFVSDGGFSRVMVFDLSGGITDGMNAVHVLGQPDFATSGCPSPPTQSSVCSVGGMYYDTGNSRLFISDYFKNRTLVFDLSGGITDGMNAVHVLGQPDFITAANRPTSQSTLSFPHGIDYDSTNHQLYIADSSESRVLMYDISGGITDNMNASSVEGQADYQGNPNFTSEQSDNANPSPYGLWDGANGIAEDSVNHRLYVADYSNDRILVYNLDANNHMSGRGANYVLGATDFVRLSTSSFGASCANSTRTCQPIALAADGVNNRLFVADFFDSRVMIFDFSGGISNNMAASHVLGQPNFTTVGEHCGASTGQNNLCDPAGLAYDSNHDVLYVSDQSNSRVVSFDANPGTMTDGENALHEFGQPNYTASTCDNGGVSAHSLCSPEGISYDNADNWLFVTEDDNNRILVYDMSGTITDNMNASHVLGQSNFTTFACNNGGRSAHSVCNPFGAVAYDATTKRLFVPDTGNARVLEFSLTGGITDGMNASQVIGTADSQNFTGKGPGCTITTQYSICDPQDLVYDQAAGKLYVPTVTDNRVMIYDIGVRITTASLPGGPVNAPYSQTVGIADSGGSPVFTIPSGSLPPGTGINGATGVISGTPNTTGNYTFTVQVSDAGGETASQTYTIHIGVQITTTSLPDATLSTLYSQTVNIANANGSPTFSISTGILPSGLSIASGTGVISGTPTVIGDYPFTVHVVDSSGASDSKALSIHVAKAYAASDEYGQEDGSDNPVWAQNGQYNNTGSANNKGFGYPTATVIDSVHHRLFVAEDFFYRVLVFNLDANNNLIDHTADNVIGEPDFTTSTTHCGASETQSGGCYQYVGMAYDSSANELFVSDSGNDRVLVYDLSGGITNGMNAVHVLGQPNFTTDNFTTDQHTTSFPEGLALDTINHRLFVADDGNDRVLVYDLSGGITDGMNAVHVLGQPNFTSLVSGTTQNQFNTPEDLAFNNTTQQLFVGDSNNDRVLVFDASPGNITDGMNASHVLGQPNFTSSSANTSQSGLGRIEDGFAVDEINYRLFVDDDANNRVIVYDLSGGITDGMNASNVLGQSSFNLSGFGTSQAVINDPEGAMAYDSGNHRLYVNDSSNRRIMVYDFAKLAAPAPSGAVGSFYSFDSNGHSQGSTTFSLTSGVLPNGLSLNASTGQISGTPTVNGVFNFSLHLADDNGGPGIFTADQNYSVTISASSSGGGNKQGGGQKSQSQTPAPEAPVDLDSQPGIDSTGFTTTAADGQQFTFTDSTDNPHTITVGPIGTTSSGITVDTSSDTVNTGEKISKDVNKDGKNDIDITLNSINDGEANLTFHKIIFAIAPGGNTGNNGFGAGSGQTSPPAKTGPSFINSVLHHIPKIVLLAFPWLLFILLGLSVVRLTYLSFQERRFAAKLAGQLAKERALNEQRNNFITLASHYLRTPVTTISTGLEMASSLSPDTQAKEQLKTLSSKLNNGVNNIIAQAEHRAPSEMQQPVIGTVVPGSLANPTLAAGFIQLNSLRAITIAMLGAFGLVGLADYILAHVDLYNVGLVHVLTQLAGLLLLSVMLLASLRSYRKRKELRLQAEKLLANQRELDAARNTLIKNGLNSLKQPLKELKTRLSADPASNPRAFKPALDGISQLEGLLTKFVIATSLEGGSLTKNVAPIDIRQLAGVSIQRYTSAIQGKYLAVKNEVEPGVIQQDPLLISFVLDSLLNNAIKYSRQNSEIKIEGRHHGNSVELTVSDKGIGIAEDKQSQLFEPFSRAESATVDFNAQGAGLNLYLDKLVMDYLGGQIQLDSKPGQGTVVSFSVPSAT